MKLKSFKMLSGFQHKKVYKFLSLNEMRFIFINLQLHLPNKQSICFWENQNLKHVIYFDLDQEQCL